jgi:hypothetical protein
MGAEPEKSGGTRQPQPTAGSWIAIGAGVGAALGVVFGSLPVGIALGAAVGAAIGATRGRREGADSPDAEAAAEERGDEEPPA